MHMISRAIGLAAKPGRVWSLTTSSKQAAYKNGALSAAIAPIGTKSVNIIPSTSARQLHVLAPPIAKPSAPATLTTSALSSSGAGAMFSVANAPVTIGRRSLHTSPRVAQDWRRPPHFGGGGGGRPPMFTLPLLLLIGALAIMVLGGVVFVLIVPLFFLIAIGSFLMFAARNGRASRWINSLTSINPAAAGGGGLNAANKAVRELPLLGQWGLSLLGRLAATLAANAEREARLGRYLHHNLQARVRSSGTIRDACGRGVMLGPPSLMTSSSVSVGMGGIGVPAGGAQRSSVHVEAPLLEPRLGLRGMLVVDATVTPRNPDDVSGLPSGPAGPDIISVLSHKLGTGWAKFRSYADAVIASVTERSDNSQSADPREAEYQQNRKRRMEERFQRRERRRRQQEEAGGGPQMPGSTLDMGDLADFLREMAEDVADEARIKGDGRPPMSFHVDKALLQLPGGRFVDLTDEIGGLYVEEVFTSSGASSGDTYGGGPSRPSAAAGRKEDRGRVIDADFFERRR